MAAFVKHQEPAAGVTEFRVHGVGGAPPESLIGHGQHKQVAGDDVAGFYRSTLDRTPTIEAYSWGGISARKASRALWVLMLPFSLVNLAGWMLEPVARDRASAAPDRDRARASFSPAASLKVRSRHWNRTGVLTRLQEVAVHMVATLVTTTYIAWVALLSVNYTAYQCAAQEACREGRRWLEFLGTPPFAGAPGRRIVLGMMVPLVLLGLFVILARVTRSRYDDFMGSDQPTVPQSVSLEDPRFWDLSSWQSLMINLHIAAPVLALSALLGWSLSGFGAHFGDPRLATAGAILLAAAILLGVVDLVILLSIVARSTFEFRRARTWTRSIMILSLLLLAVALLAAQSMRASDQQLAAPAGRDLWGFGWAPILLLAGSALALGLLSVAQVLRWIAERDFRPDQFLVPVMAGTLVLWPLGWVVVPLLAVMLGLGGLGRRLGRPAAAMIVFCVGAIMLRLAALVLAGPLAVDWPRPAPVIWSLLVLLWAGWPSAPRSAGEPAAADSVLTLLVLTVGAGLRLITSNPSWLSAALLLAWTVVSFRWLARYQHHGFRWNPSAAVAAFAILTLSGLTAGVTVRLVDWLDRGGDAIVLRSTSILEWMSAGAVTLLAWTVGGFLAHGMVTWLVVGRPARDAARRRLDGAPRPLRDAERKALAESVSRWTAAAEAVRAVDVMVTLFALLAAFAVLAGALESWRQGTPVSRWLDQPVPDGWQWLVTASSLVAVTILGALYGLVRSSLRDERVRRRVGTVWDVLGFWPRRFHALAPPAYAARAVPELRERLREATKPGRAALLAGHSQGSVIALAAIASLAPDERRNLLLVTHGSPLQRYYGPYFPRYFTPALFWRTARDTGPSQGRNDGSWLNFYRTTDPVAAPIDLPDGTGQDPLLPEIEAALDPRHHESVPDVRLEDPWRVDRRPHQPPPQVQAHSFYPSDEVMAGCLRAAAQVLARGLAADSPSAAARGPAADGS